MLCDYLYAWLAARSLLGRAAELSLRAKARTLPYKGRGLPMRLEITASASLQA